MPAEALGDGPSKEDRPLEDIKRRVDEIILDQSKASPAERMVDEDVKDRTAERELRQRYAFWWLGILVGQLILMNLVFIMVGQGALVIPQLSLNLFMAGTLAEVFLVIRLIVKFLFRPPA